MNPKTLLTVEQAKDYKEFLRKLEVEKEYEKDEKYIVAVGGVFVVIFFVGLMIFIHFNK